MLVIFLSFLTSCQTVTDFLGDICIHEVRIGPVQRETKTVVVENRPVKDVDILPLNIRMANEGWNVEELDTARSADYLSDQEKDVILATNTLRSNPQLFAGIYVKEIMNYYNGTLLQYPNEITIQTQEGLKPVEDLYKVLEKQKPLGIIYPSKGISMAAGEHAAEQSQTGDTGHNSRDGSSPVDRMNRHGKWDVTAGENISYGTNDGLRIVLMLAIDDGVPSRGHRKNLLNKSFNVCGVGIDSHPVYRYSCTIDYAGAYKDK